VLKELQVVTVSLNDDAELFELKDCLSKPMGTNFLGRAGPEQRRQSRPTDPATPLED
jgi:hypothetical protein